MTEKYYAHSKEGMPRSEWQPLEKHLKNVAELARSFADPFGSGDWAYLAGLWHDLGKYQKKFQEKLLSGNDHEENIEPKPGKVDHSTPGALFSKQVMGNSLPPFANVLAYLIAGHHTGLSDWIHAEGSGGSLGERLEKHHLLAVIHNFIPEEMRNQKPPRINIPGNCPIKDEHLHLWIRILFSCLVDADFLDTEKFMDKERVEERRKHQELIDLFNRFNNFMEEKQSLVTRTTVNRHRSMILKRCRERASLTPGFFSLTVPTGGGKTLSSMSFALEHALKYGKKRVIVAIPYTSIIEQTAEEYRLVFGEENVIEHHHNLDPDRESLKNRLAAENWDAPIIVTTNIQLFESLYASRTSACRKLHNLTDSVLILDEAQMLPPEFLKPIISVLRGLVKHFGVTVILCTATQPALKGNIGVPPAQFEGIPAITEIIEDTETLSRDLKRVEIIIPQKNETCSNWEGVSQRLIEYKQVLCIVNSRKDCRDLHALMPEGALHLSGLMCAEERSEVIRVIKDQLRLKNPLRVISTQLVEAGVDVDFPIVFRAMAGFDSLAQSAGRCNREGTLNDEGKLGQVVVFNPPKPAPPGLLRKGEDAGRELLRTKDVKELSPELFNVYFRLFFQRINDFDYPNFSELLVRDARSFRFQFRSFSKVFHLINNMDQKAVIVWYQGKNADSLDLIALLRNKGPDRWLLRKLQRFIVQIPARVHGTLLSQDLIEDVHGYSVQAVPGLYQPGLGLLQDLDYLDVNALLQ